MKKSIQNTESFSRLVSLCNKQGDSYNPSNPAIGRTALQELLEEARKSIVAVHSAQGALTEMVNARQRSYDKIPVLATRIAAAAQACGLLPDQMKDLQTLRGKLRSNPFPEPAANPLSKSPDGAQSPSAPIRFNRQLGFWQKRDNFAEVIRFLKQFKAYAPSQTDLTIEGLQLKLDELGKCNDDVDDALRNLRAARRARNKIVLGKNTGLIGVAKLVKQHMKAEFGFNADEYKEFNAINFHA